MSARSPLFGWLTAGPLLVVLCLTLATTSACNQPDVPNWEFFYPNMVDTVPFDWYDPNPVTKDGHTFQAPPAGSISRNTTPFEYGATPEEAARAGRELVNEDPTPTPASKARGEQLFVRLCAPCHGVTGEGDGPVIPRFPQPPSLKAKHARELADGQIYHVIMRGQGVMQRYGAQVPPEDRWKLVNHIRTLQGGGAK